MWQYISQCQKVGGGGLYLEGVRYLLHRIVVINDRWSLSSVVVNGRFQAIASDRWRHIKNWVFLQTVYQFTKWEKSPSCCKLWNRASWILSCIVQMRMYSLPHGLLQKFYSIIEIIGCPAGLVRCGVRLSRDLFPGLFPDPNRKLIKRGRWLPYFFKTSIKFCWKWVSNRVVRASFEISIAMSFSCIEWKNPFCFEIKLKFCFTLVGFIRSAGNIDSQANEISGLKSSYQIGR